MIIIYGSEISFLFVIISRKDPWVKTKLDSQLKSVYEDLKFYWCDALNKNWN